MRYKSILDKMCHIKYVSPHDCYNIIVTLDKKLFNPLLVLIYAMRKNFRRRINLFVFQSDFEERHVKILTNYCKHLNIKLDIINIDPEIFKQFGEGRIPNVAFYYFEASNLLPENVERALYLDIDILPRKDISALYDIDFESSWLVACSEYPAPFFNKYFRDYTNNEYTYSFLYTSECIYNSGVLLLNLSKFRENRVGVSDFIKISTQNDKVTGLADQLLINRFTKTDIKLLPQAFFNSWVAYADKNCNFFDQYNHANEVYSKFKKDSNLLNSIVHFTALPSIKPWNALEAIDNGKLRFVKVCSDSSNEPDVSACLDKYISEWWFYAQHIPALNYGELVAHSISLNAAKELAEERRNNHLKDCTPGFANIAPLAKACQSSISEWSQGEYDADYVLYGKLKNGADYACHTKHDEISWWMADLKDYYKIKRVKLFKRDRFRERYSPSVIEILFSLNSKDWFDWGFAIDSIAEEAYILDMPGLLVRYIKVQVRNQPIHFKRIGIYI